MKYFFILLLVFCSCGDSRRDSINSIIGEWLGKEILFPLNATYTVCGERDTMNLLEIKADYRIISYVDSEGCINCKLQLPYWKRFIHEVDSVRSDCKIPFLFYFYPKNKEELYSLIKSYCFTYPICIDTNDSLNKLNRFPADMTFQTFLLDSNNIVLAIGNPILNPKVKELYLKIIQGGKIGRGDANKVIRTKASIDKTSVSLGSFDWQEEQKATFVLKNVGDRPLAIQDVTTSCGCTTVTYSKEPALPGRELALEVVYKAEHPEHFDKTITVYCNAETSPLILKISGEAK